MAKTLVERCSAIYAFLKEGERQSISQITIKPDHVYPDPETNLILKRDQNYFQVRINEMYLTYDRKWAIEYDPLVLVTSEFIYDKRFETVPFVVGPSMIDKAVRKLPKGMIFSNTRVAGVHPYRGGRINLTVILCRTKRNNYVRNLLNIVESVAKVVDFSSSLAPYLRVAEVTLDGIETVFGLDNENKPLIGMRKEYDPDAGDILRPTYFALIDAPNVDHDQLWVQDGQLYVGKTLTSAEPYREADFVLYSLVQTEDRTDINLLPFFPTWERVLQNATRPEPDTWRVTKADMASLHQSMITSPDLTRLQFEKLTREYIDSMKKHHDLAVQNSNLAGSQSSTLAEDNDLDQALEILDL